MSQAVRHDSILDLVLGHCYSSPDTAAIVMDDNVVTYQELRNKIYKVSAYIQGRGVRSAASSLLCRVTLAMRLPLCWDVYMRGVFTVQ